MAKEVVTGVVVEDDGDWEKIKTEITCSICYELFTDPRTLPCLHTFCKSCIQRSVETGLAEVPEGFFKCPLCRAHVPLPNKSIEGISANFSNKRLIEIYRKRQEIETVTAPKCRLCVDSYSATMWCMECDVPICSECFSSHKRTKLSSQHQVITIKEYTSNPKRAIEVSLNPGACPSHPDQLLKFYCYTCEKTICVECALLDHPRGEHKFDSIARIIVAEKEEVLKTAAPLESMRTKVSEALNRITSSKDDVTAQHVVNVRQVNSFFDELHQILDQQREVMLKQLESLKESSQKSLDIQTSDLSFLESKLKSCREFVSNLIEKSSASEILSFKSQVAGRVADLTSLMEQAPLEPLCTADSSVWCIDPAEFVTMCQSVCHVFCSPHPPNCVINKPVRHYKHVDGKRVNVAMVTVSLQDRHGNAIPKQCEHFEVVSDHVSKLTVKEEDKDGVYKITYQPVSIDAHSVVIRCSGCDITQCNIPGLVRDYAALRVDKPEQDDENSDEEEQDSASRNEEEMDDNDDNKSDHEDVLHEKEPTVQDEHISVVTDELIDDDDMPVNEVQVLIGEKLPSPLEDLDDPSAPDHNGEVDRVKKPFNTITKYGPDGEEFGEMCGLCCGPHDELIVSDYDNNKLIVFNKDLQYSHTIGEQGGGEGQFRGPGGVVCDKNGQVYVADKLNYCVQVFKLSGDYVTAFGTYGNEDGQFCGPNVLALSSTGLLYVCDSGNRRIQVFDTKRDHQFQYSVGHGNEYFDVALNATEDKLFAVAGAHVMVFTAQGHFLYSIAQHVDHINLIPLSICCTPDGHLLVGHIMSAGFLSVYHEDGTLVTAADCNLHAFIDKFEDQDFDTGRSTAVHMRKDGQIVVAYDNETNNSSIFGTKYGIILL